MNLCLLFANPGTYSEEVNGTLIPGSIYIALSLCMIAFHFILNMFVLDVTKVNCALNEWKGISEKSEQEE